MIYLNKQIQERLDHIEFQIKYLKEDEELQEDVKDKNVNIEAFQKSQLKKKIEFYKEAKELFEKAFKLIGTPSAYKERFSLIRKALVIEINADVSDVFYDEKDIDIKEEFENFKKDLK